MIEKTGFAIAIDGPVGVGKSTTARMVAQKLGFTYIDTGAMYRAVALYNIEHGIDLTNNKAIEQSITEINITLRHADGAQCVYLNDKDVTDAIRTQEISEGASVVASNEKIREKLVTQQKQMADAGKIVMDGRDIGSKVLPWAQIKIYLDADQSIRAKRRMKELEAKGQPSDYETILQETKVRDHRDKTRPASPLVQTPDAIYIDTGEMVPKEVAEKIIEYVNEVAKCSTK